MSAIKSKNKPRPYYKLIDFSDSFQTSLSQEELEDVKSEFVWFFNGENNAQQLFRQLNYFYLDGLYKKYVEEIEKLKEHYGLSDIIHDSEYAHGWFEDWKKLKVYDKNQFLEKVKNDDSFSEVWGDMGVSDALEFRKWGIQIQFDLNDNASVKSTGKDQLTHLISTISTSPTGRNHIFSLYNASNVDDRISELNLLICQIECTEMSFEEKVNWFYQKHLEDSIEVDFNELSTKVKKGNPDKIKYQDSLIAIPKYKLNLSSTFNRFSSQKQIEKSECFCLLMSTVLSKVFNMSLGYIFLNSTGIQFAEKRNKKERYKIEFTPSKKDILKLEYNQIKIKKI